MPFGTAWMGEHDFAPVPVALYGVVLLMAAVAYYVLVQTLLRVQPADARLARRRGPERKGNMSTVAYVLAIPSRRAPAVAFGIYVSSPIWFVPDRRIERPSPMTISGVAPDRRVPGIGPALRGGVPRTPTTGSAYALWRLIYAPMNGQGASA